MDAEILKATVLAKGKEIAPIYCTRYELAPFVSIESHVDHKGFSIYRKWQDSESEMECCRCRIECPANNGEWWIAAKLLDIPTEMPIEEFEAPMSLAQHYHELRKAHDAGWENGSNYEIERTPDQSWEAFIGDYGKGVVLTKENVVQEVEKVLSALPNKTSSLPQPPKFVFFPPDEWEVCPDCKGYSVVPGPCFTCLGKTTARKGIRNVMVAVQEWANATVKAWR